MNRNPARPLKTHSTTIDKNTQNRPKTAQKIGPKNDPKIAQNSPKMTTFYDPQSQIYTK